MTNVAFATLGCKVNQYDTDLMKTSFLERGYSLVGFDSMADVYVVNTCTVTGMAARKSRQMIARVRKRNADAVIVVTGCLGQLESNEVKKMTGADIVTGNVEKTNIVDILEDYSGTPVMKVDDIFKELEYSQYGFSTQEERTRVFIKVQDGCDNFCSYCAIPFARGRSRSRKAEEVLEEIKSYADKGTKEVVITGIHLDAYGQDLGDSSLMDLLEAVNEISGLHRMRLGSLEPLSITQDFVKRAASLDKLCHHFHLSLQSGCDSTLERMKRRYTTADFAEALSNIRKYFPDAAITTDIIVGFPGETESEFRETYDFVSEAGFMKIHVFRFSARKGTLAYGMPDKVPGDIKKHRSEILSTLSEKGFAEYIKSVSSQSHEVIAERESPEVKGYWEGHTDKYVRTLFRCSDCIPGSFHKVNFEKIGNDFVFSSLRCSGRV